MKARFFSAALAAFVFMLFLSPAFAAAAELVSSPVYAIDRGQGLLSVPSETSLQTLKANLSNDLSYIKMYDNSGAPTGDGLAATGMRVTLETGGAVLDSLKIVVHGDASGDGRISISDYTLARLDILGLKSLSGEYRAAADVSGDKKISISDYTLMRLHILGLKPIVCGPSAPLPLAGKVIGLDPGHQAHANYDREPVSPGSSETKAKVSSGTRGSFTGIYEYEINLQVGMKLKGKLEALGATVIMTRESHDVDISNSERALMMNQAGADCWLRIHANGSDNSGVRGMFMLVPANGCMNASDPSVRETSVRLGTLLLDAALSSTGAVDLGVVPRGDQTGFNWSSVPVCNIEMGHMTNEAEDRLLTSDDYQEMIAQGLAQGFIGFFS